MKRMFDLSVASLVFLAALPMMVIVAALLWAQRDGPVLFRQQRPGLGGHLFLINKFRTMRAGDESDELRLTRLGHFLRSTSLDELPALWNVLVGDMSLVGPRPLLIEYLALYTPHQARRHEVRPGVTGWAQINGRNEVSWEQKFEMDLWYVENQSLWLDLKILAITPFNVIARKGVNQAGHATTDRFRGSCS
jgi:sugar transferase EpsL